MIPTIKDFAKRAKVSVFTVSNVINNKESVTKGLKKRVLEVIEELRYRPNRLPLLGFTGGGVNVLAEF